MANTVDNPLASAVEGIAQFFGLGPWFRRTYRKIFNKPSFDTGTVQKIVSDLVSKVLADKRVDINVLENKLNSLPIIIPVNLTNKIRDYKKGLESKVTNERKKLELAENYVDQANTAAIAAENAEAGAEGYAADRAEDATKYANQAIQLLKGESNV